MLQRDEPEVDDAEPAPILMNLKRAVVNNFGINTPDIRAKFDLALLPIFRNPNAGSFKEKELCGAILLAFCFDPLWDMMHAWRTFVADADEYHRNPNRKMLHFNSELFMLEHLTIHSSADEFSNHFSSYIRYSFSLYFLSFLSVCATLYHSMW